MPRKRSPEAQALFELEEALSEQLRGMQGSALERASEILGCPQNVHTLHGAIGGKNNLLVDCVRAQFADPRDFLARWFDGLTAKAREEEEARRQIACRLGTATNWDFPYLRLARLMQDPLVLQYTQVFLERNFCRNLEERTRAKPEEALWRLWFGDNRVTWGLLIAPDYRGGEWVNDVRGIRRAPYKYWTVGHVMRTGLIDPSSGSPVTFATPGDLITFYRSVLKRLSNSRYEQAVADRYVSYLEDSDDHDEEPFLIPELRYAGLEHEHVYRLDYAVLNPHAMEFVGFELSPHSTHGAVAGLKSMSQADLNRQLAAGWAKEMDKRNAYFARFGITTVTFTDEALADMDACFEAIKARLAKRGTAPPALEVVLKTLAALDLSGITAA